MAEHLQIDLSKTRFTIGLPIGTGMIPAWTALSLINTFRTFSSVGIHINYVSELFNSVVDFARNNVVHSFLENPEHEKLIWIDADMQWHPDDLIRLCCWSTLYPVVAALYSSKVEGDQKLIFKLRPDDEGQLLENEHGLVRLEGLGLGFCIMDRSVFETMMPTTEVYIDKTRGKVYRFFKTTTEDGAPIGEDIYFMRRWSREFGGEVLVDPDIDLGHVGQKIYKIGSTRKAMAVFNEQQLQAVN